jgi:hypothetical protein
MMDRQDNSEALDQWHLARWSKFTASENYKLLVSNGSSMFGAGAMTYIKTKAMEMSTRMWERPELEEVKSLLHGKMYEYPAYKALVQATGLTSLRYLGTENPLFLEYEPLKKESGGSPDVISLTKSAAVEIVAEIKCPKNPMYHFERLKWKTQWDVKEGYLSCYSQIQNLMMIANAGLGYFVSFDERQINPAKKIKIIEVLPEKKFQDNLDIRLRMAVKEKYRIYDEHMNA